MPDNRSVRHGRDPGGYLVQRRDAAGGAPQAAGGTAGQRPGARLLRLVSSGRSWRTACGPTRPGARAICWRKSRRRSGPDWYLRAFDFDREKLLPIAEELANLWEVTYYHRELRAGAREMLQALKDRGYHLGVISNNASLYNVFNVLDD